MSEIVIQAEHISKRYRLGSYGSGTLKEDLHTWWQKRVHGNGLPESIASKNELWALRDINFQIKEGEVIGFIGRNGAGKSTLLKLISRITTPTTGRIAGRGRVATLLEVGTGFHNELTGRENIFLNGAILGMKTKEIKARFDEIVDFSGVEQFIDTPVKRYSSGMYVRLAFAVAANLDPEILIVDEVLAVGDAAFQRKCLGKMKEVSSRSGKTILFVSHNMQALKNLCTRMMCLDKGLLIDEGDPEKVIAAYLKREQLQFLCQEYDDPANAPGNQFIRIKKTELVPRYLPGQEVIDIRTPLEVNFAFWLNTAEPVELIVGIQLHAITGECIFDVCSVKHRLDAGLVEGQCVIPGNFLNDGSYYLSIAFVKDTTNRLFHFEACLSFDVEDYRANSAWFGKWLGYVRPAFPVLLNKAGEDRFV